MSEEKKELNNEALDNVAGGAWDAPLRGLAHRCPKCGTKVVGGDPDELCHNCKLGLDNPIDKIKIPKVPFKS